MGYAPAQSGDRAIGRRVQNAAGMEPPRAATSIDWPSARESFCLLSEGRRISVNRPSPQYADGSGLQVTPALWGQTAAGLADAERSDKPAKYNRNTDKQVLGLLDTPPPRGYSQWNTVGGSASRSQKRSGLAHSPTAPYLLQYVCLLVAQNHLRRVELPFTPPRSRFTVTDLPARLRSGTCRDRVARSPWGTPRSPIRSCWSRQVHFRCAWEICDRDCRTRLADPMDSWSERNVRELSALNLESTE